MEDTTQEVLGCCPEGMKFEVKPASLPRTSALLGRKVYWHVPLRLDGTPGWIVSEIACGAPDPQSAANGITMQVKSTRRLDGNAPVFLFREAYSVPFSLENYGESWFLFCKD